jgi:hypothetical protein
MHFELFMLEASDDDGDHEKLIKIPSESGGKS